MTKHPTSLLNGRFLLQSPLGEGGMARVYRAYDRRLQVWRAVKVLLPQYAQHRKLRMRFESEAQAMALLEHPNIVRVYDVGTEGDTTWIIMELCDGGAVEDWLASNGPMPPRMAVSVALQVCAGIGMAHDQGVIHRDIKPQNVLISQKGVCKVTDFGIAQLERVAITRTGTVMGTLGFMAPEQRSNAKMVDARADVYAVGATLFNLVTGTIHLDLHAADRDASILRGYPEPLVPVVMQATAYDRDHRFDTIDDMADALRAAREHLREDPLDTPPLVRSGIQRPPAPSVVEQAMAEAKVSAPDVTTPLPGETLLPAASLIEESDLPPSLRKELKRARPPAGELLPKRPPRSPATDSWITTTPEMFDRDVERMTPEQKSRITALPWVPAAERRAATPVSSDDKRENFDSLYEEPDAPFAAGRGPLDIGLEDGEHTWDDRDPENPESDDPTGELAVDDSLRGAAWVLNEAWAFLSQMLSGILGFLTTPVQYVLWPLVAILLVGTVSSMNGATYVSSAHQETESSWRQLEFTLDQDADDLVTELDNVGATSPVLDAQLDEYHKAKTEEERQEAARKLAAVMAEQYRNLDDVDDPALRYRRKVLGPKIDMLSRQASQYQTSEEEWREAAQSTGGKLAVSLGLARKPPPRHE